MKNLLLWNLQKNKLFTLINLSSYFVLLFIYRVGSLRVENGNNPGLRDFGCYVSPGRNLINGNNPYLDSLCSTRYGVLGLMPFGIFDLIIPRQYSVFVIQLLSLIGAQYFVFVISKEFNAKLFKPMAFITLWISAMRENLVVAQATGLFIGLSAYVIKKFIFELNSQKNLQTYLINGLILAFLLDIKPHLFGFLVILILSYSLKNKNRRLLLLLSTLIIWISSHIVIDLYVGRILEIDWLSRLFGLVDISNTSGLPESIAIWPLLSRLTVPNKINSLISYTIIIFILIFMVKKIIQNNNGASLYFAFLAPAFYVYYHHYDMIAIIILTFVVKTRVPSSFTIAILEYSIIPVEFLNLINNILLFIIIISLYFIDFKNKEYFKIKSVIFGTCIYFIVHFANSFLSKFSSEQTLFMTEFILVFLFFSFRLSNTKENAIRN